MTMHSPSLGRVSPRDAGSETVVPLSRRLYRAGGKRAFETLLILLALPAALTLIGLMALGVALDGHNPFYTQVRLGRNGRPFRMFKLRTMVPRAEALLQAHLDACPEAALEWASTQKLKNDPRMTRLGRLLRKTSMDELPQILNVLGGSMALVGPRPMMPGQRHLYFGKGYYNLRPGITGPWQISERNESDFVARVHFDDAYDERLSLGTDLSILRRTFGVVLRCTGH